ncbi:carbohydrate binding family 9 domain-containing protein, partial [Candidatus Poribacteria bacterium]|nr:carbohydrate binding family 9 domain-containing protein [Candidatus Poribacteria bacterium]
MTHWIQLRKREICRFVNSRRQWTCVTIFILIALLPMPIGATDQPPPRVIRSTWVDHPPVIDGDLSEDVWQQADIATHFFRAEPVRGVPAKLNTQAMVLYDEKTLYVGMRCEEPKMNNLRETQTRRDATVWQDDAVEVVLDTYNDQRNCYVFAVNTLGTQTDERISNESVFDLSWDAKWQAKVKKNGDNWTAEIAIPFRELRFDRRNRTWGINFWRAHPMDGESYSWADTGGDFGRVSEFGKLTDLDFSQVKMDRRLGILPYVTHRALENQEDDADSGVDLILPLSTNLTSNLTFNPDFSQLESDPTQINI